MCRAILKYRLSTVSINVGVDISTNSEGYIFLNQQHYSRTTSATVSVNSKAKYA